MDGFETDVGVELFGETMAMNAMSACKRNSGSGDHSIAERLMAVLCGQDENGGP